jgi:uncharacterized protein (DUF1800 family)
MVLWNREAAAHLLRRAGFGAPPAEVDKALAAGRAATVDALLGFKPSGARYRGRKYWDLRVWWFRRMLKTAFPAQEKLTLFWHGHFATGLGKVGDPRLMSAQNGLFRERGTGRFADLLLAVARDPAMVYWLDNHTNVVGNPNENFARELLELFTLGVRDDVGDPNYTQDDVRDAARAFTGWSLDDRDRFRFYPDDHDHDPKTVLGLTGNLDGTHVIEHLAAMPVCARYLGRRLWTFYAYPDPEPAVLDALQQAYLDSDGDIATVLRALFLRDEFHSPRALAERVNSPVEFVVGTIRTLGGRTNVRALPDWTSQMGQDLYEPPNVAGWPGGLAWMNSVTRLHRFRFAWNVVEARSKRDKWLYVPVEDLFRDLPSEGAPAELVQRVLDAAGIHGASNATRATLASYLEAGESGSMVPFDPADESHLSIKGRGALGLALTLPEASLS